MLPKESIKKIVVGSTNPVKIKAVKDFFTQTLTHEFTVEGVKAPSGVSDQPRTLEETIIGAENRSKWIMENIREVDLAVGLEGGISFETNRHQQELCYLFSIVAIQDRTGYSHYEQGGKVMLPTIISEKLKNGAELGPVMDQLVSESNIKHKGGTIAVLTSDFIDREQRTTHNIATAFIPRNHPDRYKELGE